MPLKVPRSNIIATAFIIVSTAVKNDCSSCGGGRNGKNNIHT